jgi:hypothetical protein
MKSTLALQRASPDLEGFRLVQLSMAGLAVHIGIALHLEYLSEVSCTFISKKGDKFYAKARARNRGRRFHWSCSCQASEGGWSLGAGVDLKYPEYEASAADEFELLDLRRWDNCLTATRGGIDEIYNLAHDMRQSAT